MSDSEKSDLMGDAASEIADMAREGLDHPSTKPVLTAGVVGAVLGTALPVVSLPLGLAAGAGFALYQRIKK